MAIVFIIVIVILAFMTLCFSCMWVYNDCLSRDIVPTLWTALVALTGPLVGITLYYTIVRKDSEKRNNYDYSKLNKIRNMALITVLLLLGISGLFAYLMITNEAFKQTIEIINL